MDSQRFVATAKLIIDANVAWIDMSQLNLSALAYLSPSVDNALVHYQFIDGHIDFRGHGISSHGS